MEIVDPIAQQYAARFSSQETDVLKSIAEVTESHPHANMLSGHVQGQFLSMISKLMQPMRILEIGTFVGYSGICLAQGLADGGILHTIELRDEDAATAAANFERAGVASKIVLHKGVALDIIPFLNEQWDIVFIDADKVNYSAYYSLVLPSVRSGGLIIADNVFFHGQVLGRDITGKNPIAIHAFNEMIKDDQSVEKVMVTLRDGLFLIRKK